MLYIGGGRAFDVKPKEGNAKFAIKATWAVPAYDAKIRPTGWSTPTWANVAARPPTASSVNWTRNDIENLWLFLCSPVICKPVSFGINAYFHVLFFSTLMLIFVAVVLFLLWPRDSNKKRADTPETEALQYSGINWMHFCFRNSNKDSLTRLPVYPPSSVLLSPPPPTGKNKLHTAINNGRGWWSSGSAGKLACTATGIILVHSELQLPKPNYKYLQLWIKNCGNKKFEHWHHISLRH